MVRRTFALPAKLVKDSIFEAILEIRFEHRSLPEVLLGRIADSSNWQGYLQSQLSVAELPLSIRQNDPTLRFQPTIELTAQDESRTVKFGPNVISYHRKSQYPGWTTFKKELEQVIDLLFEKADGVTASRLGLRYTNTLSPQNLEINSIGDLDLTLAISDESLTQHVNLNFMRQLERNTQSVVRIATKDFVQGNLPPNTSVIADVDVFTNDGFSATDKATIKEWLEYAHDAEKRDFFSLLKEETINKFREK